MRGEGARAEMVSLAQAQEACGVARPTLKRWAVEDGTKMHFRDGRLWVSRRGLVRCLRRRGLPPPEGWAARPRILIADDDADLRELAHATLRRQWPEGDIQLAADGELAWSKMRDFFPDLLVADLRMPGMDGMRLAQAVGTRPEFHRTKILTMTAFDDMETRLECFDCGADEFLKKPFEPHDLRLAAVRLLGARPYTVGRALARS